MKRHNPAETRRTILVTGGHVTPAIAVIDEIRSTHSSWTVVFVGRKYAFVGDRHVSEEFRLIAKRGIPFQHLTTGRLPRYPSLRSLLSLFGVPVGVVQALAYILRVRPDVVMSFGGYVAFPVVLAAKALGVPVVTHEQTHHVGLANRIIARFADRVYVSFKESLPYVPAGKSELSGLPIRDTILKGSASTSLSVPGERNILYITGGSAGAVSLNEIVFPCIPSLVATYTVIHQTGRISESIAREVRRRLPKHLRRYYIAEPFVHEDDLAWILHRARLVIGRSGANTVGEVAVLGIVALFIPLPWSAGGEQRVNAESLARLGSAVVLDQETLTPEKLLDEVAQADRHYDTYRNRARANLPRDPRNAVRTIVRGIEAYAS